MQLESYACRHYGGLQLKSYAFSLALRLSKKNRTFLHASMHNVLFFLEQSAYRAKRKSFLSVA
jgi:hypothetical protein